VPKRRYQDGTFRIENDHYYSFFTRDLVTDGKARSGRVRIDLGKVDDISELSARREHGRLREQINRERGSVPTAPKGETFGDVAKAYFDSVAPHLSCSTVRQRQSHMKYHLKPRFGTSALMSLDVSAVQQFATELLRTCSRKTIVNVLGTLFAILAYAKKCGVRVPEIAHSSLTLADERGDLEAPYFKPEHVAQILDAAREPYKTIFSLAWTTGLRAGELLGLTVADLDFQRQLVLPRKQADDATRLLRELKTKRSKSPVPMTPEVATLLTNYLRNVWRDNPSGLLFPNRINRPCKRANVVRFGLHPVLRKLGLPTKHTGLHAFRHGLGTALSNSGVSPATVQRILRHTDIKTTLKYYVHTDTDAQRDALARVTTCTKFAL
jgi:integrase